MADVKPFKSFQSESRQREEAEVEAIERELAPLVASIPTQQMFDEWIAGFPAEYRKDMRRRFEPYCTFPRSEDDQVRAIGRMFCDEVDAALKELKRHPARAACADPECQYCGVRDCPHHDPDHYGRKGCPSCRGTADTTDEGTVSHRQR